MKNIIFRTKLKIRRIEQKKTNSILSPDQIVDAFENKDEIIAYSIEHGLTKKSISDKADIEDIDALFIIKYFGKKVKRDSKITIRKYSGDKKVVKKRK